MTESNQKGLKLVSNPFQATYLYDNLRKHYLYSYLFFVSKAHDFENDFPVLQPGHTNKSYPVFPSAIPYLLPLN